MTHDDILELARETAGRLGITIKDPALVLENMETTIGTATILYNNEYTLWIDKHYIAYSDNFKPQMIYVFADEEHVSEELREVIKLLRVEKSKYVRKTLTSVKAQLQLADTAMRQSGDGVYLFERQHISDTEEKRMTKVMILTLCHKCRADFETAGDNYIRRVDPKQKSMELCTVCNVRRGYDYELVPKGRKEGR